MGFLSRHFFVSFFYLRNLAEGGFFFQDLALDLKEKPLKIAFLMLKTSKFFACGADDYPTITNTKSPLALKVITTKFKVPSELTPLKC